MWEDMFGYDASNPTFWTDWWTQWFDVFVDTMWAWRFPLLVISSIVAYVLATFFAAGLLFTANPPKGGRHDDGRVGALSLMSIFWPIVIPLLFIGNAFTRFCSFRFVTWPFVGAYRLGEWFVSPKPLPAATTEQEQVKKEAIDDVASALKDLKTISVYAYNDWTCKLARLYDRGLLDSQAYIRYRMILDAVRIRSTLMPPEVWNGTPTTTTCFYDPPLDGHYQPPCIYDRPEDYLKE